MIKNLSSLPPELIFEAFKDAFSDYAFPMAQNFEEDLTRWQLSQVDFSLSYGYFEGEKLLAFVLHVPVEATLFNLLTGVIHEARGQRLIPKIYETIQDELKPFKNVQLVVLEKNEKAIKMYERMGFKKRRSLHSFEGKMAGSPDKKNSYEILPVKRVNDLTIPSLFEPTAESSRSLLLKEGHRHELHLIKGAFALYTPLTETIHELGAQGPLEQNIKELFLAMKLQNMKLNNVDEKARELIDSLMNLGFTKTLTQFEMELMIPPSYHRR